MQTVKGLTVTDQPSQLELTANLFWEDGQYIAECVELGTMEQGDTEEEAISNLREAVVGYLQAFPHALNNPSPSPTPYIERARQIERAYARAVGEEVEPANIRVLGSTTLR